MLVRQATGEIGFRGTEIINEPTAAAAVYDVRSDETGTGAGV